MPVARIFAEGDKPEEHEESAEKNKRLSRRFSQMNADRAFLFRSTFICVNLRRRFYELRYSGHTASAVLLNICSLIASERCNPLNLSRFCLISGIPGLGQSVPNRAFSPISSSR